MELSVIIPIHNRENLLPLTLSAISKQTLSNDMFEVIVVDDGSEERTRERLHDYKSRYNFKLMEKEWGGLASARNLGSEGAMGRILYFLDDDVIPAPDTLRQHLQSHANVAEPIVVVGSLPFLKSIERGTFIWYLERGMHYDLYENKGKYRGRKPPLPPLNGNSSIPAKLFFEIGKYDETFRQYGGEDIELGYRLEKSGVEFVYNPLAIGYHNHRKDFLRHCVDQEKSGESLIKVYRKYPEIKVLKKIDIVEDKLRTLSIKKKTIKIIMVITMRCPWILKLPRFIIRVLGPFYCLRYILFPFYYWVSHYAYALGMQKGLEELPNKSEI